ncbi:GNAT family N-acetyltransferase [Halobacteriales archaeon Cl-PHB]
MGIEDDGDLVAAALGPDRLHLHVTVFDVVVAADRRDEGMGYDLMAAVQDHPDITGLPGRSLLCRRGLVLFYESVGFELDDEIEVSERNRGPGADDLPERGVGDWLSGRQYLYAVALTPLISTISAPNRHIPQLFPASVELPDPDLI